MQLVINSGNEIESYIKIGISENSVTIDDSILPDNFESSFKPGYYLYENGAILVNTNYVAPNLNETDISSAQQKFNAQVLLQLATLIAKVGDTNV